MTAAERGRLQGRALDLLLWSLVFKTSFGLLQMPWPWAQRTECMAGWLAGPLAERDLLGLKVNQSVSQSVGQSVNSNPILFFSLAVMEAMAVESAFAVVGPRLEGLL